LLAALLPAPPLLQMVVEQDGVMGLFGRGLKTKIIANGMQVRDALALSEGGNRG
jgi:hypothetical protein